MLIPPWTRHLIQTSRAGLLRAVKTTCLIPHHWLQYIKYIPLYHCWALIGHYQQWLIELYHSSLIHVAACYPLSSNIITDSHQASWTFMNRHGSTVGYHDALFLTSHYSRSLAICTPTLGTMIAVHISNIVAKKPTNLQYYPLTSISIH